ncbi:biopolymer transporter ExbB [Shimia sp.]|uniref:biopolymer transporter ExbB n=1 Tax=Shimia sp. TaxID=1954381 RepID=UPI003B8D6007
MDQPDRKIEPRFNKPTRQIVLMLIVLALVGGVAYVALPQVLPVFTANPELNGFIFFVFLVGVAATFGQVLSLFRSVRWIEGFAGLRVGHDPHSPPTLLASLATLLRERGAHGQISSTSSSSILESVATRIDEGREITRYIVNLLIFLGLLGTFYGLATTVPAVVDTIQSLDLGEGDSSVDVVARLMDGLESQLGGMGVAFASSLLGLAGSLVVGLLELFASHGQNRFYRELEEWLSSITRVGFTSGDSEGGDVQVLGAAFEHMSGQLDQLRDTMVQTAHVRSENSGDMSELVAAIHRMADRMETQAPATQALLRVAEGQEQLLASIQESGAADGGMDAESRMRLRSIDVQMLRILEEISAGRQESMTELRTEMAMITRLLRRNVKLQEAQADGPNTKVNLKQTPRPKGGREG